jgi:hypothetical protein
MKFTAEFISALMFRLEVFLNVVSGLRQMGALCPTTPYTNYEGLPHIGTDRARSQLFQQTA